MFSNSVANIGYICTIRKEWIVHSKEVCYWRSLWSMSNTGADIESMPLRFSPLIVVIFNRALLSYLWPVNTVSSKTLIKYNYNTKYKFCTHKSINVNFHIKVSIQFVVIVIHTRYKHLEMSIYAMWLNICDAFISPQHKY